MWSKTSGETMQSRSNASCRCAHAGVIFSPPQLGVLIRGYGMEAIDTTRSYVMQQGSKEKHTVSLCKRGHMWWCGSLLERGSTQVNGCAETVPGSRRREANSPDVSCLCGTW